MPDLLFKLCPKCRRMMPVGNGARLCASCAAEDSARKRKRDYAKEYANRRDDKEKRSFYRSKAWRLVSRKYAQSVGYRCERCGDVGTDVHHKEPIDTDKGWAHRYDMDGLELLCVRCHNAEHGRTFGNGWSDSNARWKAEEASRDDNEAHDEGGEGGEDGGRGFPRVSDYRV